DIINSFKQLDVCKDRRKHKALDEHKIIFNHIIAQEPEQAALAMKEHLRDVSEYSQTLNKIGGNGHV
ncbi:MAG: FCD domain-containing protein, partial [Bacteroidota bacterium]